MKDSNPEERDAPTPGAPRSGVADRKEVRALAERALSMVASRLGGQPTGNRRARVRELCDAVVQDNPTRLQGVLSKLVACGVPTEEIYESYIPATAQMLGELWMRDELSFVDVTVGATRLQEVARSYGGNYAAGGVTVPLGQTVLVCVPEFENHSLGAFMAADQFRRLGLWVHMAIGQTAEEIARLAATHRFAMIGISCGSAKMVEPLSILVENLKTGGGSTSPIVIGGKITSSVSNIEALTGADHATSNIRKAVELCGIGTRTEALPI